MASLLHRALVVWALALASCSSTSETSTSNEVPDGGPSSSGTSTGTTPSGPVTCSGLFGPTTVGATWEYEGMSVQTDETMKSSTKSSIAAVEPTASAVFVDFLSESVSTSASITTRSKSTSRFRCDERGVFLLSSTGEQETTVTSQGGTPGTPTKLKTTSTYDGDGAQTLPASAAVGTTWTATWKGSTTVEGGSTRRIDFTTTNVIEAGGSLTTKAGTFDTVILRTETTGATSTSTSTSSYAVGVGLVKSGGFELVSTSF